MLEVSIPVALLGLFILCFPKAAEVIFTALFVILFIGGAMALDYWF